MALAAGVVLLALALVVCRLWIGQPQQTKPARTRRRRRLINMLGLQRNKRPSAPMTRLVYDLRLPPGQEPTYASLALGSYVESAPANPASRSFTLSPDPGKPPPGDETFGPDWANDHHVLQLIAEDHEAWSRLAPAPAKAV